MAFQLPTHFPFPVDTKSLGRILFKPFLTGTLLAFSKALKNGEETSEGFVRNFTADQARSPCTSEADLNLQYEKGLQVDVSSLTSEDVLKIANEYLQKNKVEMVWYASGDSIDKTESGQWNPADSVKRHSVESDIDYLRRLAQECVNESTRSWDKISKSFRSVLDLGKMSSFAQADLNTKLSANRIKAIIGTPAIPLGQSVPRGRLATLRPDYASASVNERLSELVGEVQKVGALIAEQSEIQRNQNVKTDLLIEASNEATGQADQNLKWAKYGIFLTSVLSMASLGYSIHLAHQQEVVDNTRHNDLTSLLGRTLASQNKLMEITKFLETISNDFRSWRDKDMLKR